MQKKLFIKYQLITVLVGVVLLVGKFALYVFTSSNAIFSDALESVVNVAVSLFSLYSLYLSSVPRDDNHPYGHGKIEFIAAGLEGGMIAVAGIAILFKATLAFFSPPEIQRINLAAGVILVTAVINFAMGKFLLKKGKAFDALILVSGGKHLLMDAYSTAGIFLGLMFIYFTGYEWMDNAMAVVFGGLILVEGVRILRKAISGIMDETDFKTVKHIVNVLEQHRVDAWIDVHNLRVQKYGADMHIDCHLTLPWYYNLRQVHDEVERVEQLIDRESMAEVELFVHTDPCIPSSCRVCKLKDCPVRQHAYTRQVPWNVKNLMRNKKHL